jgi:hypothetical protein
MNQNEPSGFSWELLFIVTAVSFLSFSLLTKLLDGSPAHVSLFLKIGLIALGLGIISTIGNAIVKPGSEK